MKRRHTHDEQINQQPSPWWRIRARRQHRARTTDVEPAHDQPWVPRSAMTDGTRRSARRQ